MLYTYWTFLNAISLHLVTFFVWIYFPAHRDGMWKNDLFEKSCIHQKNVWKMKLRSLSCGPVFHKILLFILSHSFCHVDSKIWFAAQHACNNSFRSTSNLRSLTHHMFLQDKNERKSVCASYWRNFTHILLQTSWTTFLGRWVVPTFKSGKLNYYHCQMSSNERIQNSG